MHTPALRVPCSPEPRLLPSRAKEQLLRGALRPPRLLSWSVWAAATGSTPGGLTGSRRVSAAFPAAGRPRAGPQRMQGLARTYLLVHRSRLLTASSHGGRGEQLRGLSVRTPTPPWGSALVTSPPARGPASHTSRLLGDTAGSPRRSPDPPSRRRAPAPGPHRGRRCRPGHALLLRAALGAFAVFSPSIPDTCPLSLPPILVRLSLFLGQGRLLPLVSSPLEPPCARPSLVALEMCM